MIFVLPTIPQVHAELRAALRLLPPNAEVVVASDPSTLPSWLNRDTVRVCSGFSRLPVNIARGHRIRAHLHAACLELGDQEAVYVPPGSAAITEEPETILNETLYGARLAAHPQTYQAELERTAFILEREGFVPRLFNCGTPLKINTALADITFARYGYRTHFESMYLRGCDSFVHRAVAQIGYGEYAKRHTQCHLFKDSAEAKATSDKLPTSTFELPESE